MTVQKRAENVARFIEVNSHLMLDLPVGADEQWVPLVQTAGDLEPFKERFMAELKKQPWGARNFIIPRHRNTHSTFLQSPVTSLPT